MCLVLKPEKLSMKCLSHPIHNFYVSLSMIGNVRLFSQAGALTQEKVDFIQV